MRLDWEIARRGYRRYAAYPGATWAGVFTNTIFGLLQAELTQPLVNDGDVWFMGTLRWPERRVDPDGRIMGNQICAIL